MAALDNLAANPTSSMPQNLLYNLAAMNISQSPQSLGLSIKPAMVLGCLLVEVNPDR
jgi:hypothetical protein